MDFLNFGAFGAYIGKGQPATPIEDFARFQAGFLSSEDFHCILQTLIDLHRFYRF